jgi:DNA-binding transcriptional ArsR family regulator
MTGDLLGHTARLFKALGHPGRLRILAMLRHGELCVCQITAVLDLAPSTVSAHLAELRRAGLVTERKDGRWVHYALRDDPEVGEILAVAWRRLARDPGVADDDALLTALRSIPATELCRVGRDLSRLAISRPATSQPGPR